MKKIVFRLLIKAKFLVSRFHHYKFNQYIFVPHSNQSIWKTHVINKVWGKKKCTRVCVYYKNYARFRQKSIKSAKSTHPENSKLVRQVHVVQKVPPGSMIEQKNGFCENTIFVKNYLQKKVHLHLWISCKIC